MVAIPDKKTRTIGVVINLVWAICFVTLVALSLFVDANIFWGIGAPLFFGFSMILSKLLEKWSSLFRAIKWFSHKMFYPRTGYNHIIWGLFLSMFGVLEIVSMHYRNPRVFEAHMQDIFSWLGLQ
ncbi:hypothetical protein [Desulfatibacillum aliphaticivorans]|uniref:hypothetical protein n=1 Tax=Desulfatibacillum aliphaticivorans TaxID=218208 RepID=UPI0005C25ADE|nr:hypothetical protein [Desulfatibacillum aliphaticivorans]